MAIRIRNQSNLGAGAIITAVASVFLFLGRDLPLGSANEMGAGWFPRYVALLALAVGLLLIVRSLRRDGPPLQAFRPRPLLAIVLAVIVFSLGITRIGLLITAPATILLASLAAPGLGLRRMLLVAGSVTAAATLVFVWLLGLTIPLLPD